MTVGKLTLLIILFFTVAASAQEPRLRRNVNTPAHNITIDELSTLVKQQTGLVFSFNAQAIQSRERVPLDRSRYTLEELLGRMKSHFGIDYRIIGDHIVFSRKTNQAEITGRKNITGKSNAHVQTNISRTGNSRADKYADTRKNAVTDKIILQKNKSSNAGGKGNGAVPADKAISSNNKNGKNDKIILTEKPASQKNKDSNTDIEKNETVPADKTEGQKNKDHAIHNAGEAQTEEKKIIFPQLMTSLASPRTTSTFARVPSLSSSPPASVPPGNIPLRKTRAGKTWLPEKFYAQAGVSAEEVFYFSPSLRFGLPYAYGIVGWSSDLAGPSTFRYGIGTRLRISDRWEAHLQGVTGTLARSSPVDSMGMTFNMELKGRHYRIAALAQFRAGSRWHISAGPSFNYFRTKFYYEGAPTAPENIPGSTAMPDSHFSFFTPPFVINNSLDRTKTSRITTWIGLQAGIFFSF